MVFSFYSVPVRQIEYDDRGPVMGKQAVVTLLNGLRVSCLPPNPFLTMNMYEILVLDRDDTNEERFTTEQDMIQRLLELEKEELS